MFVTLLSKFSLKKQRWIILRELLIAFMILLFFNFFGDHILKWIGISQPILSVGGGVVLLIIALSMIFPKKLDNHELKQQEPMIIPLAMPLIAGPGAITTVMLYAEQMQNGWLMSLVIFLAWLPSLLILVASSKIKLLLGQKGLNALQKLGGMLICLLAVQMVATGVVELVKISFPPR